MRRLLPLLVGLAVFGVPAPAKPDAKALRAALREAYSMTKRDFGGAVSKPGTIFVVKREGIVAGVGVPPANTFRDGAVLQDRSVMGAFMDSSGDKTVLAVGDRVFVTDILVTSDTVSVYLLSTTTAQAVVRGSTRQDRLTASVKFEFPDDELQSLAIADVQKSIEGVLKPDTGEVPTIGLGQTEPEVEAALGKPARVVNLGSKIIWSYSDLKVTFVDGKVADVE